MNKLALSILSFSLMGFSGCTASNWETASRESANLAPRPDDLQESIYQIYTARAFAWRGLFATHPWISWKRKSDKSYSVAQVTSWALGRPGSFALSVQQDIPDRFWFGNEPTLIFEVRGEKADRMIARAIELIEQYPYKNTYRIWPGPNSNTFVEHVMRYTPELTLEMPPHAIGKDFLTNSNILARSPSGTGVQLSLFGVVGFTIGAAEGIELNILSLVFGIDFLRPALKIPFYGRLGMPDKPL